MICAELSVFNKTLLDQLPRQKVVYNNNANYLNFYLQKNISYLQILSTFIASSFTFLQSQMSGLSSDQVRQINCSFAVSVVHINCSSLFTGACCSLGLENRTMYHRDQNLICLMWHSFKKASTLTIKLLKYFCRFLLSSDVLDIGNIKLSRIIESRVDGVTCVTSVECWLHETAVC